MSELLSTAKIIQKILKANFKMNPYAKAYLYSFPEAEELYGTEGTKTQILYFFSNCKAMTPEQKETKKELMAYAKRRV